MEKLYCRIINPLPIFSILADKVKVRDHVRAVLGEEYLIPQYGVYDLITVEDVEKLPNSFVLKANHGAGFYRVVTNKSSISIADLVLEANQWLLIDYSRLHDEKHYRQIKPKLVAEKALLIDGKSPTEYKIHVLKCRPEEKPYVFIQIMAKFGLKMKNYFFLEDWTKAPFRLRRSGVEEIDCMDTLKKPALYDELMLSAKKLAQPFNYSRIDFYIFEDQIYFGEMTFSHAAGNITIEPDNWDSVLGKKFGWPDRYLEPV